MTTSIFRGRRALGAAAGLVALACATPATSVAAEVPPAGTSSAAVAPVATCAIRSGDKATYWFGYTNIGSFSIVAPVGAENSITRPGTASVDAAQPDQFRPGTTARSVAVKVAATDSVTWTVTSSIAFDQAPSALSATAGPDTPACASGTPTRSANMRIAGATIQQRPLRQARNSSGQLTDATVLFSVSGARAVCSEGTALPPLSLWGFSDGIGVSPALQAGPYAPMPAQQVVRTDTFTYSGRFTFTEDFQRTWLPIRRVADPQAISTQFLSDGTTLEALGLSQTVPTVDLTAYCLSGRSLVWGSTSFIGGSEGQYLISATNPATQATRTALPCIGTTIGCDFVTNTVGPGGTRVNR